MTDELHVAEITGWVKKLGDVPQDKILSVGDVGQFMSPSEMGFDSEEHTQSHVRILNQFKAENNLTDTVLMPCTEPTHAAAQPCYCACNEYRERAHFLFTCDVCQKVPVGTMYACAECADVVYNLCESCYAKYYHGCGKMQKWETPMHDEEQMDEQLIEWQAVTKVREPVNTPVEQATMWDQLRYNCGFFVPRG